MKGNAVDIFWEKKEIKWAKQTKLLTLSLNMQEAT